ncbi:hypothetical protein [Synechococcus sp. M16CYN]|uniref:hypothetical protein n=1 Tax=Synechococcus sp. M16CYN TaxID=3103139 RepID=UPI00333F7429
MPVDRENSQGQLNIFGSLPLARVRSANRLLGSKQGQTPGSVSYKALPSAGFFVECGILIKKRSSIDDRLI